MPRIPYISKVLQLIETSPSQFSQVQHESWNFKLELCLYMWIELFELHHHNINIIVQIIHQLLVPFQQLLEVFNIDIFNII